MSKKTKTFDEFDKSSTDSWASPKYLVQPAEKDKGFALVKSGFHNMTNHFKPGISDAGLDLPEEN